MDPLQRAYALVHIKSVDAVQRVLTGIVSTPAPDRQGDVMEPTGATFTLPMPLLWQHQGDKPIGEVVTANVTPDGIAITARLAKQGLLPFIDEAWTLIAAGLVKGLSVGWRALAPPTRDGDYLRFSKWAWLETSAVTLPANTDATILSIKSADAMYLPAVTSPHPPGDTGTRTVVRLADRRIPAMKTATEQIAALAAKRAASSARMTELQQKAIDENRSKDDAEKTEFDTLHSEVKSIDDELVDLRALEDMMKTTATPVTAPAPVTAPVRASVVQVTSNLPPGIGFARYVKCAVVSHREYRPILDVAKDMYPHDADLHAFAKATKGAIPAGTTTDAVWASPLVFTPNLAGEFLEFLMPKTIIGQFGQGGIPPLHAVPFNVRIPSQESIGDGYWVGQGAPKPLTSMAFDSQTLYWHKLAAIAVITEELARFSSPSADTTVRNSLTKALTRRMDIDFIHPANAGVTNVKPKSITNGLTALTSSGTAAANVILDLQALLVPFLEGNVDPASVVLIMPTTLALALSLMLTTQGVRQFPTIAMGGGTVNGLPVIASQYAANESGAGNMVIAVDADSVLLADDGGVSIDASREASLQMLDNPTNNASTATPTTMVSMFQTNSIALRAERFITWQKARANAVVYMDDVNWGAVGSPG